jgi:hypothetical protein
MNSPEDGPVSLKHVEIRRFMNKIEIVTSVGFFISYVEKMHCTKSLKLSQMSAVCSAFSSRLITSNISSILIIFHHFFSRIALGTVDLHVYVIWVTKANAVTSAA